MSMTIILMLNVHLYQVGCMPSLHGSIYSIDSESYLWGHIVCNKGFRVYWCTRGTISTSNGHGIFWENLAILSQLTTHIYLATKFQIQFGSAYWETKKTVLLWIGSTSVLLAAWSAFLFHGVLWIGSTSTIHSVIYLCVSWCVDWIWIWNFMLS